MKGKKLPKRIWVVADELGWYASEKPRPVKNTLSAFYAPANPAKTCRWTRDSASIATNGKTACGWWVDRDSQFKFCPRCGGKIVGKR